MSTVDTTSSVANRSEAGYFMSTASIKDVAHHAGVAVGTVSNVLNYPDRVAPRTRARVLDSISQLGFVRNDAARQLRAGSSRTIGLIVLDIGNPFYSSVSRAAEDAAAEAGNAIVVGNSGHDVTREKHYIDLFEEQRVQGILISPVGDISEQLTALAARGTKVVIVDSPSGESGLSSVSVDDVHGGYLAARHLLETGRRRLAFATGPQALRQMRDRLIGARKAVSEVPAATLEVLTASDLTILAGRDLGETLSQRPPSELPEGLFCANDLLALGAIQALTMLRTLRIPEDIALIGYDDIDFASSSVVPLSSIRQPAARIGETAMELLLEQSNTPTPPPRSVVFSPELVIRQSTSNKL